MSRWKTEDGIHNSASERAERGAMAKAGQVFENPVTGERMLYNKTAYETNGKELDIEFFVKPGADTGLAAHFHPSFAELAEIIAGSAHYKVGQTELTAEAGDMLMLPRNVPHVHPWNTGNEVLHWRKITRLDTPDQEMLQAAANFFESLYALAQQGKVGENGLPTNPLQLFVLLHSLEPSAYVAGLPLWLQRPLFSIAAVIGQALGYKPYYPAVSVPAMTMEQGQSV